MVIIVRSNDCTYSGINIQFSGSLTFPQLRFVTPKIIKWYLLPSPPWLSPSPLLSCRHRRSLHRCHRRRWRWRWRWRWRQRRHPGKGGICLLGGVSSINPTYRCGSKCLMRGARGPLPQAAAIVVMDIVGSCWLLVHVSKSKVGEEGHAF